MVPLGALNSYTHPPAQGGGEGETGREGERGERGRWGERGEVGEGGGGRGGGFIGLPQQEHFPHLHSIQKIC